MKRYRLYYWNWGKLMKCDWEFDHDTLDQARQAADRLHSKYMSNQIFVIDYERSGGEPVQVVTKKFNGIQEFNI